MKPICSYVGCNEEIADEELEINDEFKFCPEHLSILQHTAKSVEGKGLVWFWAKASNERGSKFVARECVHE